MHATASAEPREVARENRRRDADAHRLTSSAITALPCHLESRRRRLFDHHARRHARIRGLAGDRHAEVERPQNVGAAEPERADEIGHHVALAGLAAVDQQRHARGPALRQRVLGHDAARRIVGRLDLGARRDRHAIVGQRQFRRPLRLADDRGDDGLALALTGAHAHRALPPQHGAGLRVLREDVIGGDLGIGTPHRVDLHDKAHRGHRRLGIGDRLAAHVGDGDLARARRHAHGRQEEHAKGHGQRGRQHEQPAGRPHTLSNGTAP